MTETPRLTLVSPTPDEARADVERMSAEDKAQLSPDWLARLRIATGPDPWTLGFNLLHRSSGVVVGACGFKGPPGPDATVEIAYGIAPEHRNKGYATEAAGALVTFALESGRVRLVRAHTIAEDNASTRVLIKCGFKGVGQVVDPEDGLVWRWERTL